MFMYSYQQQEVLSRMKRQKITIKINKHTPTLINNKRFYHESIIKKLTKRSTNIVLLQLLSTRRGFIKNETSKKHNKNQQTW